MYSSVWLITVPKLGRTYAIQDTWAALNLLLQANRFRPTKVGLHGPRILISLITASTLENLIMETMSLGSTST